MRNRLRTSLCTIEGRTNRFLRSGVGRKPDGGGRLFNQKSTSEPALREVAEPAILASLNRSKVALRVSRKVAFERST